MLLSAHFQGFCRDLYTEGAQFVASNVAAGLQILIQQSFIYPRTALDHGNPNLENIKADFNRFGFILDLPAADPANARRLADLSDLMRWRNAAAHHGDPPTRGNPPRAIPLTRSGIVGWKGSCTGLAASLDGIMYNRLRGLARNRRPWVP